jgi:hypothetical protein
MGTVMDSFILYIDLILCIYVNISKLLYIRTLAHMWRYNAFEILYRVLNTRLNINAHSHIIIVTVIRAGQRGHDRDRYRDSDSDSDSERGHDCDCC